MTDRNPDTDKNYQFIKKNWDALYKQYPNKFVIVSGEVVVDFYDTYESAANAAIARFADKEFIIHHISGAKPLNFIFAA